MNAGSLLATALLATLGCKSASRPGADGGPAPPPRIDCDAILTEGDAERACVGQVTRRLEALGEGWELTLSACNRKFVGTGGGLGFRLQHAGDEARSRARYEREEARARSLPGYAPLPGIGAAAMRFSERVGREERPTLVFRRGPWIATFYGFGEPQDGAGGGPRCTAPRLARLARVVGERLDALALRVP